MAWSTAATVIADQDERLPVTSLIYESFSAPFFWLLNPASMNKKEGLPRQHKQGGVGPVSLPAGSSGLQNFDAHDSTQMKKISATYCIPKNPSLTVPNVLILAVRLTVASLVLGVGE